MYLKNLFNAKMNFMTFLKLLKTLHAQDIKNIQINARTRL